MKWCCFKVCGGGPSLCMWHLRSLSPTTVFETPNAAVNFAVFHDDAVSWKTHLSFALSMAVFGVFVEQPFCYTYIFRSTSESRPNSIEGKNVRTSVRTSVRPQKFLQFE